MNIPIFMKELREKFCKTKTILDFIMKVPVPQIIYYIFLTLKYLLIYGWDQCIIAEERTCLTDQMRGVLQAADSISSPRIPIYA
jgi:hypothetical protein